MGISKSVFKLLIVEAKKGAFTGKKLLQLGRQHTFLTFSDALKCVKAAKFDYATPKEITLSFNEELKRLNYVDDVTLFSLLGFDEVHSLDVSPYERSSIVHDLNQPVAAGLQGQYDVVFDGGTLEHVFHVPQVFRNIHALLKNGGTIIHCSPSHNHVDHGFYMFSPTLFGEYYAANQYKQISSYVFEYAFENNSSWNVYDYQLGCLDALSFGGFGKKMLGIWFSAQKLATSSICAQNLAEEVEMASLRCCKSAKESSADPSQTF